MTLGRPIYSLLKRHSNVFVKGLGTFRRIRTAASFDSKRNVVLPPLTYIEFEHGIEEGFDFILYIQQSHQLDRAAAEKFLQNQVDQLVEIVQRDGHAEIEELGQLVEYGHSFVFKPFDLSGFQFDPVSDPYVVPMVEEVIEDSKVYPQAETVEPELIELKAKEILAPEKPVETLHKTSNRVNVVNPDPTPTPYYEEERPRRNNAMVYALIAVLALITLGGIYYYSVISKKLDDRVDKYISALDSTENEDALIDTIADNNAMLLADTSTLVVQDTLPQPKNEEKTAEKAGYKYTIVIGTHPKFEQAEAEAAEYHKKGFEHVRALPSNLSKNRKKVIWDTYATKELRDSALRYVQKNINPEAWPTTLN